MRTRRIPPIACPHCDQAAAVRGSETLTALVREVRYRCDNIDCGHSFVANIEIVRTVQPSLRPKPGVNLPIRPHLKPANDDDNRRPANDDTPPRPAVYLT